MKSKTSQKPYNIKSRTSQKPYKMKSKTSQKPYNIKSKTSRKPCKMKRLACRLKVCALIFGGFRWHVRYNLTHMCVLRTYLRTYRAHTRKSLNPVWPKGSRFGPWSFQHSSRSTSGPTPQSRRVEDEPQGNQKNKNTAKTAPPSTYRQKKLPKAM